MDSIRPHILFAGMVSFCLNILFLASPLYMLQVYDRALTSGSVGTLVFLTLMLVLALATLGALDAVRSRTLVLAGEVLDHRLAGRLLGRLVQSAESDARARSAVLREFDAFRAFFSGQGVQVLFDIPWTPVFVLVSALLHPWLGALALAGAAALLLLAFVNEQRMRTATAGAHESAARAYVNAECALEGSDEIKALGMRDGVVGKWLDDRGDFAASTATAGRRAAGYAGAAKFLRLALQSGALGLGAYLAINQQITAGAMIAGSILVGRALTPLDQVFGAWRSAGLARGAHKRIREVLRQQGPVRAGLHLSDPKGRLRAEAVLATAPGGGPAILKGVSLAVEPGEMLGVVGPTGAGKSTLAKALAGVRLLRSGVVRLDGADISQLDDRDLGRHVGYLPQEADLLPGTIADNISRFERFTPDADERRIERDVLEAARAVGAHDMILALPQAYDTVIGVGGRQISGGQRQRIALARALYRNPALVILDEPNAHLDSEGERALLEALAACRRERRTVVVITHRPVILAQADALVFLEDGLVVDRGRRDDVVRRLQAPAVGALKSGNAA